MKRISIHNLLLAGMALAALVLYIVFTVKSFGQTTFDDAFMITRYARHWLEGSGFSWNAADGPTYGVTSPLYLFIVTAVLGLTRCSAAMALTLTSYSAGLLAVGALTALGFLLQGKRRSRAAWVPLLAVPVLLFIPPFRYHSLTGMETTLSLLTNTTLACSIAWAVRRRTNRALLLCIICGLLSFATRPDNGLYALLLPPLFFVCSDRTLWRYALCYTLAFGGLVLVSLLINRLIFGDFLPLPFFAKAQGFYRGYLGADKWNAMAQMLCFLAAAAPFLLAIAGTVTGKARPQLIPIALVVAGTFAYYATVTQIMGWNARYYYPSLAFVVFATWIAIESRPEDRSSPLPRTAPAARILCGLILLLFALPTPLKQLSIRLWETHVILPPSAILPVTAYRTPARHPLPERPWWDNILAMGELLEQLPENTTLAASEYGYLGSRFPDLTVIDLVGLHDRHMAHEGFSVDHVLSRAPDLIWFPHGDYTQAIAAILDHPAFQTRYEYYPAAYNYGMALRRDSQQYARIRSVLQRCFSRQYPGHNLADHLGVPVGNDRPSAAKSESAPDTE